ncbi:MAG: TonB family protein [Nitrospiraceae bacterium]
MTFNSQPSISKEEGLARVHGWIVSAVGHAILVAALVMTQSVEPTTMRQESFRWNVQVVTSAPPALPASEPATTLASAQNIQPAPAARSEHSPIRAAPPPVTQRIERKPSLERRVVEASTVRLDRPPQEAVHEKQVVTQMADLPRIEHPTPREREQREERRAEVILQEKPAMERSLSPAPVVESTEPIMRSAALREHAVMTRPMASPGTMLRPHEAEESTGPSSTDPAPSASAPSGEPVGDETSVSPVQPELPHIDQSDMPASAGLSERVGPVRSPGQSVAAEQDSVAAPHSSSGESKRSDYGWLASALRARIEEIKRYSAEARSNEWEGRVVVIASVKADGRLVDIRVVESSGNGTLDEDAKRMVSYASPVTLSQPLGSAQVTVKVPIVFGLQ